MARMLPRPGLWATRWRLCVVFGPSSRLRPGFAACVSVAAEKHELAAALATASSPLRHGWYPIVPHRFALW